MKTLKRIEILKTAYRNFDLITFITFQVRLASSGQEEVRKCLCLSPHRSPCLAISHWTLARGRPLLSSLLADNRELSSIYFLISFRNACTKGK